MAETMCAKILRAHLAEGTLKAGESIRIRIDQTLTQDATGTMAYLEFESMGVGRTTIPCRSASRTSMTMNTSAP